MISNELLEEVINVSLKGEIIDQDLLIKIIENIIDGCSDETRRQFNGIDIFDEYKKEKRTNAEYIDDYKIIRIFYLNIIKNGMLFLNLDVFETNLYMIQVVLHEVEHLKNDTIILNDDLEGKLLKICSAKYIWELLEDNLSKFLYKHKNFALVKEHISRKYNSFVEKTWEICPDEKLAEVNSNKILLECVNNYHKFKSNNPKVYDFIIRKYFYSLLMGYNKTLEGKYSFPPLIKYLNILEEIDIYKKTDSTIWDDIIKSDIYTIEDRLKYGLPAQNESIKQLKKKYQIED